MSNAILMFKVFLHFIYKHLAYFKVGLTGLSEDMEDWMLEQLDYYKEHSHKFYTSFYTTCVNMWENGVDLSDKQLAIIEREYRKVKVNRVKEYMERLKNG